MQKQNRIPNDAANCGLILEDDRGRQFLCLSGLDIDIDTGTIALDGAFKKWSGASPSVGKYLCLPFSAACRAETQQRGVRSANDMLKVLSEITIGRPWHIILSARATIRYFYRVAGRAFDPSITVPETIRLDTTNRTVFQYHIKGYDPELPKKKPVAEEPLAPIQTIKKQLPAVAYFDMDGTITAPMYRDLTNPSLVRPFFPVDEWIEYFDRPGNSRFSLCPILQPTVDLAIKLKSAGVRTEVLTAVNSKKEAGAKEMFLDRHRLMERAFDGITFVSSRNEKLSRMRKLMSTHGPGYAAMIEDDMYLLMELQMLGIICVHTSHIFTKQAELLLGLD